MVQLKSGLAALLERRCAASVNIAPGVQTPARFSGAAAEHLATRRAAGLFDFSFMYCVEIAGAGSQDFLRALQTRAIDMLACGRIAYTLLLREDGSVLIDATVWRLGDDCYWLFTGRRADAAYLASFARAYAVTLHDRSGSQSVIAVQGPASTAIIERVFSGRDARALPYFGFTQLDYAGADCWLARIGYSGERGYELIVANAAAPALWEALLAAGAGSGLLECGFEAADSLRVEVGHILFTRELATAATPAELGFSRLIDSYRVDFRGAAALRAQRGRVPKRRLVGLLPLQRAYRELREQGAVGDVALTSRVWSPLLERDLALGFVPAGAAVPGTLVMLANGERARVARLPFYDPARILPRRAWS